MNNYAYQYQINKNNGSKSHSYTPICFLCFFSNSSHTKLVKKIYILGFAESDDILAITRQQSLIGSYRDHFPNLYCSIASRRLVSVRLSVPPSSRSRWWLCQNGRLILAIRWYFVPCVNILSPLCPGHLDPRVWLPSINGKWCSKDWRLHQTSC